VTTEQATKTRSRGDEARAGRARIAEIDGLRGIALTLVVVFHLFGHGRVSGGVDVFLMISGFLLTLSLGRALAQSRPVGVLARWGRTFLRLAPPAAVVLVAVVAASFVVLDPRQQLETLREVIASALYVENWQLISQSLSYDAAGAETSPLQHFWSLSVQAQFFLVFPIVALIIARVLRSPAVRVRAFWTVVVLVTIASFVYAMRANAQDPTGAYFHTFARLWEIGAGGIVAGLWTRGVVVPAAWRGLTGWIGLAAIVFCGFAIDGASAYPGPLALVPVGGAALVLLSSSAPQRFSASRFLSQRRLAQLDRISYGLYLWHWPILIAYLAFRGREDGAIGPVGAVGVLVSAYAATIVTTWILRRPIAWAGRGGTGRQIASVVVAILLAFAPAATASAAIDRSDAVALTECSGAAALDPEKPECADFVAHDSRMPPAGIVPLEATRASDEATRSECWSRLAHDEFRMCALGDPDGEMRMLALGDSHMAMFTDALDEIGRSEGWHIDLASRGSCRWMGEGAQLAELDDTQRERCTNWRAHANEIVEQGGYDAIVVTSASHTALDVPEGTEPLAYETEKLLEAWELRPSAADTRIVAIRDNPRILSSVQAACLGDADALNAGECAVPRDEAIAETGLDRAVERAPNATLIDLNDFICGPETCNPVVGGVYVYRDNAHMTATFVETLTPYLHRALADALR